MYPSRAYLQTCLRYEADTGKLTWRSRPRDHFVKEGWWRRWNEQNAGRTAGFVQRGVKVVTVDGVLRTVRRIIWTLVHGDVDGRQWVVVARNGDPLDDRLANLMLVHKSQQRQWEARARGADGCGVRLFRRPQGVSWEARISAGGVTHYLGRYDNLLDAYAARRSAEARLWSGGGADRGSDGGDGGGGGAR